MGAESHAIERHIETEGAALGRDIDEFQHRVKAAADMRLQFQKRPLLFAGVAFGAGLLLARKGARDEWSQTPWGKYASGHAPMAGAAESHGSTGESRSKRSRSFYMREDGPATRARKEEAAEKWDVMKGALIGVAADQLKRFFTEVLPGFDDQYRRSEEKRQPGSGGDEGRTNPVGGA